MKAHYGYKDGSGDYFIVIKHRNHLPIMSAAAVSLSKTPSLYDFTTAQSQAYGTDPLTMLESGVYGAPAGDANGNGVVNSQDRETVWRSHNGTPWSYAKNSDLNLDGGIDAEEDQQGQSYPIPLGCVPRWGHSGIQLEWTDPGRSSNGSHSVGTGGWFER